MSLCKKHGKERTVIYMSKPGKHGHGIDVIGCEDCASEAAQYWREHPKPNPEEKPKPAKPKPTPEPEPMKPEQKKVRSIGDRFGFKF